MTDRVECADCPISMLCFGGRLGRTWNVQYNVDDIEESVNRELYPSPNMNGDVFVNGDGFHASVCPQCGIMTAYPSATGFEVNVTFECCLRPLSDVQDIFRTQSRYSGSTLNKSQKNKGAFYCNPENGLAHQVWFLMDDPGPGDVIVTMQCRECEETFADRVESVARRVAMLKNDVTSLVPGVHPIMSPKGRTPTELQREVNKLAKSIGGEFLDVEEEVYLRERDTETGEPVELLEWDEEREGGL